ncbi:hypothetical protein HK102_009767 [Quaeritorhiza haematococci]|nr:hypothetical protein HK102_009767 [Quaeritorhiza haematococci]
MGEGTGMTFGELCLVLESYDLQADERGDCVIYSHPGGRPVILFPRYADEELVRPIHLQMTKGHLVASGLMEDVALKLAPRLEPPRLRTCQAGPVFPVADGKLARRLDTLPARGKEGAFDREWRGLASAIVKAILLVREPPAAPQRDQGVAAVLVQDLDVDPLRHFRVPPKEIDDLLGGPGAVMPSFRV